MNRPLRLQFAGAVYHVTSRGDRQQLIFHDDKDRYAWLDMLAQVCARFNFTVHSFCLMGNHYHLLIETGDANLATGMRQLNGQYSRYFNRRHQRAGHVFQGRYVAILVQKESHLRELARYVVLNPLRANMVSRLEAWPWSSYALMIQPVAPPSWLRTDWILGQFGTNRANAIAAYRQFVAAGRGLASPIESVRHQLLLGDDDFVARHRTALPSALPGEVKREQRRSMALSLAEYQAKFADRDQAIAAAYFSTAYTMTAIAQHFQVHYRTVSRIVQRMAPQQSGSCAIVRPRILNLPRHRRIMWRWQRSGKVTPTRLWVVEPVCQIGALVCFILLVRTVSWAITKCVSPHTRKVKNEYDQCSCGN